MRTHSPFRRPRGFSLSELMVAMAIGLLILAGLTTLFVRNTRTQGEIEKANRQVENGRFAIDTMTADLQNAGYYGELNPALLQDRAALADICADTIDGLKDGLKLPVQGIDSPATAPSCLPGLVTGTDVLVVRRTRTCVVGSAGCDTATEGGPFFQASLCNNGSELNSPDPEDFYALGMGGAELDRHKRDCTPAAGSGTLADLRRYLTHIYYIAASNQDGDNIPTLKRAELYAVGDTLSYRVVPLAEGIENLQLEYGLDFAPATTGDGAPDQFAADPDTVGGCAADACAIRNWQAAVAVRLSVLARNPEPTQGHQDLKTYKLGRTSTGAEIVAGPFKDKYKRHVFQSLVALPNPAGRRLP